MAGLQGVVRRMKWSKDLFRTIRFAGVIAVSILCLAGCGGGGGGSPAAPTPALPDTPLITVTTAELAASGKSVEKAFDQGALAVKLPTATQNERYAILLANNAAVTTIKVNGGGSSGLADVRANVASLQPAGRPVCGTPYLRSARKSASGASIRANIVSTLKPATIDETLGQTVTFRVFSGGVGSLYIPVYETRTGVLRRIGTHCKLFVDPIEYGGLSAAGGAYAITEAQLDAMKANFDEKIYPLLTEHYGPTYDIDEDGKVAVFLSPMVTRNGFAGFFDTENFTGGSDSNQRDMFCMWTPDANWTGDTWLDATCETIAHEFQHLVNFSGRLKKANYDFNAVVEDEVWLDEALSMGAEVRYRQSIGDPATEERFKYYRNYLSSTSLTAFQNQLQEYGCVGLFAHYLYEQGGADRIEKIVTSGLRGEANITAAFADHPTPELRTFAGIRNNWTKAVFAELNRNRLNLSAIPSTQKYAADFDLDLDVSAKTFAHSFGTGFQGTISAGAISMFIVQPPTGYSADSSALYLQAVSGDTQQTSASINCTIMRLND